ncbi:MAG TPA: hypothetical protein VMM76_00315, partial [Pirellulaceae bacterium]|nr:hypothetical protein [Pirellulaceae bacterium]
TKGRRPDTPAFSRSIASSGNEFECRGESRMGHLDIERDSSRINSRRRTWLISAKSLGCLGVSRRSGYRVLRALFRSQLAVLM